MAHSHGASPHVRRRPDVSTSELQMIDLNHQPRKFAAVVVALAFALPLYAQNSATQTPAAQQGWNPQQILRTETYVKPPAEVERIIMAPRVDISFTTPS